MQEDNNYGYESKDENQSEQQNNQQQNNSAYSNNNNHGSSYYTPPYEDPNSSNNRPPQKKFPSAAIAIIALIVISVLLISFLSILKTFLRKLDNLSEGNDNSQNQVNMGDEEMYVVQNSPKLEITQNTDVDYVPQSIPEVVQKIGDSVVEISTSQVVTDRWFQQYVTSGAGSGVIITQSKDAGYLLTNNHVIDDATEIKVRLTNGQEYSAQLLGSDPSLDLAVLRIVKKANETFTVAPLGDSSKLAVGQQVIAIGNPLGSLGGTVTDGIISALDRTVTIDNTPMVLMQHNAAINPGNSGGGLFDGMGNLIGIVNAKTSQTGIEGLGFAIPVNIAYKFFNRIMIIEPSLGIKVTYGRSNGVVGVYVTGFANENTKFEMYDRIVAVNGNTVESDSDYYKVIDDLKVGDTVTFTVKRNQSTFDIKITLQ